MTLEQIKRLIAGERLYYKKGYVFIDKTEDYFNKTQHEFGFMTWKFTPHGEQPCDFHFHLEDALKEIE